MVVGECQYGGGDGGGGGVGMVVVSVYLYMKPVSTLPLFPPPALSPSPCPPYLTILY